MKLLLASHWEGLKASRALGRRGKEVTTYVFTLEKATGQTPAEDAEDVEEVSASWMGCLTGTGSQRERGDDWRFVTGLRTSVQPQLSLESQLLTEEA